MTPRAAYRLRALEGLTKPRDHGRTPPRVELHEFGCGCPECDPEGNHEDDPRSARLDREDAAREMADMEREHSAERLG